VRLAELADVPSVLITPGRRSPLQRATRRTPLAVAAVADQREARTAMMLAGVGPTIVGPEHAAQASAAGSAVRPLEPSFSQVVVALFDPAALSPVARSFVETLRDLHQGDAGR
jgi:hypothetical protein